MDGRRIEEPVFGIGGGSSLIDEEWMQEKEKEGGGTISAPAFMKGREKKSLENPPSIGKEERERANFLKMHEISRQKGEGKGSWRRKVKKIGGRAVGADGKLEEEEEW